MKKIERTSKVKTRISGLNDDFSPPTVMQVETAIPAFIGFTEKGPSTPTKISSMADYKSKFGGPSNDEIGEFEIANDGTVASPEIKSTPAYRMYYMLEMFFANGGKDCFIVSVGNYEDSSQNDAMEKGLLLLNNEEVPTLIVFADAYSPEINEDPTELYKAALMQCADKMNRFLICDVAEIDANITKSAEQFRTAIGTENLKYAAAYFPPLQTSLKYKYSEDKIRVKLNKSPMTVESASKIMVLRHTEQSISDDPNRREKSLYHAENGKYKKQYQEIKTSIDAKNLELLPSAAVAGVYARTDAARGVWKAPANVSLNKVKAPSLKIDAAQQENLNVSNTGKSINAIRAFSGKGVMVWGARTLAGNDNEWRYIPVRRLANMIEQSVKNATARFVNEPNDAETWIRIKAMTENYLTTLWRSGALAGDKLEKAFYVRIGVGETMTARDVQDGKMILEIGIAAVRPTEFIRLKLTQEMSNN
ncbi:phage tail sheath family protein [Aequorivita capsosiphonis]|uniref:phage tail sheath family protein n=1 Tax=Aequorivita capsosiphonis TaxID=487317 RepID=UPI000A032160|nr:phage tail sheath C-terminal domain-containing protein [Aequorivita capsosiphonis]